MIVVKHIKSRDPDCEVGEATDNLIPGMYVFIEGAEDVAAFKALVQQGSCLEPNLSPAMKELADLVTTGEIQQPYREMPK